MASQLSEPTGRPAENDAPALAADGTSAYGPVRVTRSAFFHMVQMDYGMRSSEKSGSCCAPPSSYGRPLFAEAPRPARTRPTGA